MSNMLSDTDKIVVETMRMRLTTDQALQYLKDNEFPMSRASYFRHKKNLEEKKLKRLYEIAKIGFQDQHLERIDTIELCLKLCWQNYNEEQDPYKKFQMLKDIVMMQPYQSSYYEATKLIIDKQQSEYKEFLDKEQSKQEITESKHQANEQDSINDKDGMEFNNNNAKF